jgi:hypothetical protein
MCELEIIEPCLDTVKRCERIKQNALLVFRDVIASRRHIILGTTNFLDVSLDSIFVVLPMLLNIIAEAADLFPVRIGNGSFLDAILENATHCPLGAMEIGVVPIFKHLLCM